MNPRTNCASHVKCGGRRHWKNHTSRLLCNATSNGFFVQLYVGVINGTLLCFPPILEVGVIGDNRVLAILGIL
ncbi:hypothetical protein MT325_m035R [Paramecium bursaria chlorella virus MT325]|uniref:Uncharacterized protein m035R n=1 Tax=Paramecium bursaria Chlorella virus MT325 TaxID=346932 RepID=A7ITB5_PBCVM|nr:hypothetical protein MT325_m035R [Paramecium bursaria chlorella virus MT325]